MYKIVFSLFVACVAVTTALPRCACPRGGFQVCGSDGETYPSECYFECVRKSQKPNLRLVKIGSCDAPIVAPNNCICTFEYAPVCGSNGRTYPNECSLTCERANTPDLIVKSNGQCPSPQACVCTYEYKPVCGTNGNTYANECAFKCDQSSNPNLRVKNFGECQKETVNVVNPPTCVCTREMAEVCGSDGRTYGNPCMFMCAARVNSLLSIAHIGSCRDNVNVVEPAKPNLPACACTRNLLPVCGSDGVTYNNDCLLRCAGASFVRMGSCA